MSVIILNKQPSFEIKNINTPLVCFSLRSSNLTELQQDLERRFGSNPSFFDQEPTLIDLQQLPEEGQALNFMTLVKILREHRLNPVALRSKQQIHHAAAIAAGLFITEEISLHHHHTPKSQDLVTQAPEHDALLVSALIIDKPLRSGQHVYAKGRDLIVLSIVNPGAEIMADGHIHVYAPLRGRAIAGAKGNIHARIMSLSLEAELLSIAGVYRTSDTPLPASVSHKAAQVLLTNDKLIMQAL